MLQMREAVVIMKLTKRIHLGWQELEDAKKINSNFLPKPIFGKYQYFYSEKGNTFSLVEFDKRLYGGLCWEIYQIKGKDQLLEDVERFKSILEAEIRIEELFKSKK